MLIKCKECGHEISHLAENCPHCGVSVVYSLNFDDAKFLESCRSILAAILAQFQEQPNPDRTLLIVEKALAEFERRAKLIYTKSLSRIYIEETNRLAHELYCILIKDWNKAWYEKVRFICALDKINKLTFDETLKQRTRALIKQIDISPAKCDEVNIAEIEESAIRKYKALHAQQAQECYFCKCRLTGTSFGWPIQLTGREVQNGQILSIRFRIPLCLNCVKCHKMKMESAKNSYNASLKAYNKMISVMNFIVFFRRRVLANSYKPVKACSEEIWRLSKLVFEDYPLVKSLQQKHYQWGAGYDTGIRGRGLGSRDPDKIIDL